MDYQGEKDCERRFKVGHGYTGCMCDYHVQRRAYAEASRRLDGAKVRGPASERKTHAEVMRLRRAKAHGGTARCHWPGCGAGPFQDSQAVSVHIGKVHQKKARR